MSAAVRSAPRRTGNVNADIDESLFGATRKTKSRQSSAGLARNGTAIVSSKMLQAINANPNLGNTKESVVISSGDLYNMLSLTGTLPGGRSSAAASNASATSSSSSSFSHTASRTMHSPEGAAKAHARKEKMMRLEREAASRPAQLTQSEFEEKENRQRLLGHAKQAMDEEMDDVKHMNQMMLYAQCVTIRDAQILEKQRIADDLLAEEKRIDLAMEVERVRTLKLMEEREASRAEEQRLGASVIITQIQEREQERIRQQEQREQEAQAMLARVKELELREEEERQAKVVAGRKLLEQVMDANHAQARAKLLKKQEEIDEDLRIQAYIRSKEARDAENEAELTRIRNEKEKEIARLRAMQERAQDRQAAIDELRAKRYQEAKDRQWRQGQIEQASKRESMKRDISMAREAQRQEKSRRIAEQALQEREEYMRVLDWQNSQGDIDRAKQTASATAAAQHRADLQAQMSAKEREKAEARARYLSEGQIFQQQHARDKAKLEKLKQEKLQMMEEMGVPVKYRAELAKKKMLVASIH